RRLPVNVEKHFLHDLFRFAVVTENTKRDTQHQVGVPIEQEIDGVRVLGLQPGHGVFITLALSLNLFRQGDRIFRGARPYARQRERTSLRGRTHPSISNRTSLIPRVIPRRRFDGELRIARRRYTTGKDTFTKKVRRNKLPVPWYTSALGTVFIGVKNVGILKASTMLTAQSCKCLILPVPRQAVAEQKSGDVALPLAVE